MKRLVLMIVLLMLLAGCATTPGQENVGGWAAPYCVRSYYGQIICYPLSY